MYNGLNHLYEGAVITVMKTQLSVCLPQCSSKRVRVQRVSSSWQTLSAWLILPRPWQIVSLHAAAATLWSEQPVCCLSWRRVYVASERRRMCGGNRVDLPWMQQGWCHDQSALCCYLKRGDLEAAGIMCRWTTDQQSLNYKQQADVRTCITLLKQNIVC